MSDQVGPSIPIAEEIHSLKYRGVGESFKEAMNRVASTLADDDGEHYKTFREILLDMRFMPAGRVQAAIGSTRGVTPYNCFVSGTIEDTFVHGNGCIMDRAKEAAATMRMGGGIGYDFSTLRPRGALIKKLQSKSSGPLSFMDIFDSVCRCVASSGHRRGAQMGVLRVDHPDIEEFVHAKQNQTKLLGFNISIAITDEFMICVKEDKPFELRWGGDVYKEIDAGALWETIMRSTWDWAEPGVLFIDRINEMNNLYYCETIAATNPCAEQPLPPYGACLLGSFNLVKYIKFNEKEDRYFDWDAFKSDIHPVVRAMDNVVDNAVYPLYEQEKEARSKRRMGLGVTGLANALEALGLRYGDSGFIDMTDEVMRVLTHECYFASIKVAKDKGSFPLLNKSKYLDSEFVKTALTPAHVAGIREHGIRNSHLTSIAPTGTISLCADNVSSGIEPVFALEYERTIIQFDGPETELVQDYGKRVFGVEGKVTSKVTVAEHLAVLIAAYRWVDSAVSKTCNVPGTTSWDEFKQIYMEAWENGCKGCTTFRTDGKRMGILKETEKAEESVGEEDEPKACTYDGETGQRSCE